MSGDDVYARYGYEPDDDLVFMLAGETRTAGWRSSPHAVVHIRDLAPAGGDEENLENKIDFLLGKMRTICGNKGSVYNHISEFDDSQLCRRCMKQLGDQTLRVFERDW